MRAAPATRSYLERFRRVTVMGLGVFGGGAGVARYFARLGAKVTVTDMASADRLAGSAASLDGLGVRFVLGEHRREDFVETDLVVANQAVRQDNEFLEMAWKAGIPVTTEIALALSLNRSPWVGVTGSAGKSTTAALIAAMLREHDPRTLFGGNIGGDLVTRVEAHPADAPLVVELSSFQLQYLGASFSSGFVPPPAAAVITNLAPNHLDWHRTYRAYVQAKFSLVWAQGNDGWAVLNREDPGLKRLGRIFDRERLLKRLGRKRFARSRQPRVMRCRRLGDPGGKNACFIKDGTVLLRRDDEPVLRMPLDSLRLQGRHNQLNAVQAAAAAYVMCGDAEAVRRGAAAFAGLPHRLEAVGEVRGRVFINDSKSTTPDTAVLALEAVDRPATLIAGGYDKQLPFDSLGVAIQERANGLVLVGAAAPQIREAVIAAAGRRPAGMGELPIVEAGENFRAAVAAALAMTPEGGAVLLSPACASWGMFVNYEARGAVFARLRAELGNEC